MTNERNEKEQRVPKLYTPKEVAEMFGISVHALKNRRQRGQIEGIVFDKRTVFYTEEQIKNADLSPRKRGPKSKHDTEEPGPSEKTMQFCIA